MFTGHLGIALLGKGVRPGLPLWAFIAAVSAPDLAQYGLLLVGAASSVAQWPATVAGGLPLAAGFALGGWLTTGRRADAGWLAGAVASHLPADALTGTVVLWPGGPGFGLGLYFHPAWDFALEAAVVTAGWLVYRRSLPRHRRRAWPVWLIPPVLWAFQWMFWQQN